MRRILILLLAAVAFGACSSRLQRQNAALQDEIDERVEALEEQQERALREARRDLTATDSLLTLVTAQHEELHAWVMAHTRQLNDQSEPVQRLITLRGQRDSLKARYEVLGRKIQYILARQEELGALGEEADDDDDYDDDLDDDDDDFDDEEDDDE